MWAVDSSQSTSHTSKSVATFYLREVRERSHASALLTQEQAKCETKTVAVRRLKQLLLPETLGSSKLLCEANLDLVEFGLHFGTYG